MAETIAFRPLTNEACLVRQAVESVALSGTQERGAIYTRREVVDFILDLAGYTLDKKLFNKRLLEPSFGEGDFLLAIVERLLKSWQKHAPKSDASVILSNALCAVELHQHSFESTRIQVVKLLCDAGISNVLARELVNGWLVRADFLLLDAMPDFDFVIGNPPYVRQELIPDELMTAYRKRYTTIYDRADLYIPFIESSLRRLRKNGIVGFICSDRWMKNKYGGPLRQMISDGFHLKIYVDMVDTDAFHSDVIAYPAITIIKNEKQGKTRIAHKPPIKHSALASLSKQLTAKELSPNGIPIKELAGITFGSEPWILESTDQLALMRRLERDFPLLENAGCKVGIGVATGADKAFIAPYDSLNVEPDRKLPLVMTQDILDGDVQWRGLGIINPFAEDGSLVDLGDYPKLKRYLNEHKEQIVGRHVAKKSPNRWFRTIDRIYPELTYQEKLLIPDIKGDAHIVFESGELYPHHNLYYITSNEWDLRALQSVLMSGIARLFVSAYSTRMRGGYLRFQAQYLRRIRIPHWRDVPPPIRKKLKQASSKHDRSACNEAVYDLYGFTKEERAALGGNGL
tara:strand:- start:190 stop:1905 length:1716 start_codon:yes stop_codon:yes gene_type:complete